MTKASNRRQIRVIGAHFRHHKIANGQFNHLAPAKALLQDLADLAPKINEATLKNRRAAV